ncbi:MAG: dipeptidase [Veillonella sp.]|uniref:dipeptidase n=1 Tax=Veillonella sp. TaxID=1926307 RepID=UPI0025EBA837|nr:dipeptidase [Veillonella sp.]MBS4912612.1 dipeptidase [Veillonella sp.]
MIDLHCDTIMQLIDHPDSGDLWENPWKIDIQRLKKGGYTMQDFALFVELDQEKDPYARYEAMRQLFMREMEKYSDHIKMVRTYADYETNKANSILSALLSVEEGGVFGGDLNKLRKAYEDGVRLITISWNFPNGLSFPQGEAHEGKGLTETGIEFVELMEELGMVVDCSHLNDTGTFQLGEILKKPFIASHSNARTLTNHRRNLTDEEIKLIANKGGIIGLNFANTFLSEDKVSSIENIVRHGLYIYDKGGADVVALGTDFDGINPKTEIEDAADMPRLYDAFQKAGLSEGDLEKLFRTNAERVFRDILN